MITAPPGRLRLGVNLHYVTSAAELRDALALATAAEQIGYDIVWAAEAYGSDAVTVLAAVAARTERIGIGAAVLQIPARTPAMTAMTAATLDALSGGRFHLGLGVSGPQVSEGWHGVPFGDPLGRTREYVAIVRQALSRRRVSAAGPHFPLPLPGGAGKALLLSLQPVRADLPIYLAAVGPRNLQLAGEIADGWLGIFFDARTGRDQIAQLRAGAARAIDVAVSVAVGVHPDVTAAAALVRPNAALYLGGMGSRATNFYHGIAAAMGYGEAADEVQNRYLARDYAGAAAAVPLDFLDRTGLLGDRGRIAAGIGRLAAAGVTTLNVSCFDASLPEKIATLRTVRAAAQDIGVLS